MSSGNDTGPQGFQRDTAQDVASPRDLLPNRLRMIASALLASDQSFSSAMCVEAADAIDSLSEAVRAVEFALTIDDHYDMRAFLDSWSHGDTTEWPEFGKANS